MIAARDKTVDMSSCVQRTQFSFNGMIWCLQGNAQWLWRRYLTHRGATRQSGTSTADQSLLQADAVVKVYCQFMNEEARIPI